MLLVSFTPALILQATLFTVLQGAQWTYNGQEGEHHWSKHFPYCGGTFQSPIDITSRLLRFDPTLRPIEVQNYNLSPNEQLTLGNNGHSVQVSLPSKMRVSILRNLYTAVQLHFHWGTSSKPAGSEHTVNSKQYAAEMHVVHFNSNKYSNISMAVDKSDGLAVLGVLIEVGEFNPTFQQLLKYINVIKYKGQKTQIPGFNIRGLLPPQLDEYYRYDGSLTTPPCYPSVLWTVFKNSITISREQFLALATATYSSHVQDSAPEPLNGNFRKTQVAENRIVLVSFKEGRGLHGTLTVTSPLTRKQIIQQLLVSDLADLADEGLYHLIPTGSKMLRSGKKNNLKSHNPSLRWKGYRNHFVGKLGLTGEALCYVAIQHNVFQQLKHTHTENRIGQVLRDMVFPELNLKSYLDCKSDLAPATIRQILHKRPTDEALELGHSLTRVLMKQRKTSTAGKQNVPLTNVGSLTSAAISKMSHHHCHRHSWLLPMEWED
ncbi:carbonic anhydrase 12 [Thalassophryne amazonica]|uniref:carbonic anhydrase 12 n=1 Tax=Thalassophryne amazonica TaxID=390379 RepID=UPI001472617F|nr:carbonic anhydrase 12 [Thalassophryne amazonica]